MADVQVVPQELCPTQTKTTSLPCSKVWTSAADQQAAITRRQAWRTF